MALEPFRPGAVLGYRDGSTFIEARARLDDLQRQLATGKKTDSYAALGAGRRISLDARAKLATLDGWTRGLETGDLRIQFMNQSLEGLSKIALDAKDDARAGGYTASADGTVAGQVLAGNRLAQAVDMLNAEVAGRYLFSGRSHDIKPVADLDSIMNGDGSGAAGVLQLIDERRQADAGANGLGRLQAPTVAGATVTLQREASDPPYGFTLAGATSSSAAISASLTAGPPAGAAFAVNANPAAGDRITIGLSLPDGTTRTVQLEARSGSGDAPAGMFTIGATAAATAANLAVAVTTALEAETETSLDAASAMVASRQFFAGSASSPPLRVPGPPFDTATAPPAAGAPGATVTWYRGDDDPAVSARNTATLQVDSGQIVAVGARANEEAFRELLANLAAFASGDFAAADPNARDRYEAYAERTRTGLAFTGTQKPEDVTVEITAARTSMQSAVDRHKAAGNFLADALAGVEDSNDEEVAMQILALQTRLQASYQTTAILSNLSLVNYL